jgi:hypothetical protein
MSVAQKIRRGTSLLAFLVASSLIAVLGGCANPGPPKPPTLRLPQPAKALTAERVGDQVLLSWQTSADTTDGQAMRGPITAQICRDDAPKPPPPVPVFPVPANPCQVVHELVVRASTPEKPTRVVDRLPNGLLTGEPRLVAYRVTLSNARGRSVGASAPAYALAGAAPAAVGPISVEPRRNGALIRWEPTQQAPLAPMEVTRTLLADAEGPVAPRKPGRVGTPAVSAQKRSPAGTLPLVTLTSHGKLIADVGGMVDHGIHDGDTVNYGAQRVLRVRLTPPSALVTGKKGDLTETKPVLETFELKSDPSPEVTFTFRDVIPPVAPTGLEAVTGAGFGDAASGNAPSIDLSWEPNAELDLLGYNVYRAGTDSRFARINPSLVMGPEFRDTTAEAGVTYVYRVTAVDQHHNESEPSAVVKAATRR